MVAECWSDAELAAANAELEGRSPEQVLRWAVRRFHPRLTMATAFGAEGCCILHMLADIRPAVRVINLETGYQFPETLELRERIKARYGIEVEYIYPEQTVAEYEAEHGGPLYELRPDQCCHDRKVLPLRRAVRQIDPPRFFPLVGPAQLHHCHWECVIYYNELVQSDYPFPVYVRKARVQVIYIDKDHLHLYVGTDPETQRQVTQDITRY